MFLLLCVKVKNDFVVLMYEYVSTEKSLRHRTNYMPKKMSTDADVNNAARENTQYEMKYKLVYNESIKRK